MCITRVQGNVRFSTKQTTNQDKNQVTEVSAYFNDKNMVLKNQWYIQKAAKLTAFTNVETLLSMPAPPSMDFGRNRIL